ncbi:MAG TPA: ATP-binding protein, partial [Trebonia sp.]
MLAGLLERVPVRGGALMLRGEPGIGKSALLREAARSAAARGLLVLRTSGVRSEAGRPFAGLHRLLGPVLGRAAGLPPRQRVALGAAFCGAFDPAGEAAPEPFLTALAALQLLSEAAAEAPLLLAADDAQWLDRPSAEVLAFIARRVDSDPVLLLAAVGDGYGSPLLDVGLPGLRLDGLAAGPAGELLDAAFPRQDPAARGRVLAAARGNPLALTELPAAVAAGAGLPGHLPLTPRLRLAFAARATELPRATRSLLLIAAADDHAALAEVMRAAAIATGTEPAIGDLGPAVEARLIDPGGHAVRFPRALVRSALYQDASAAERHAAHAALAEVLAGDPDRQAWHRGAAAT